MKRRDYLITISCAMFQRSPILVRVMTTEISRTSRLITLIGQQQGYVCFVTLLTTYRYFMFRPRLHSREIMERMKCKTRQEYSPQ